MCSRRPSRRAVERLRDGRLVHHRLESPRSLARRHLARIHKPLLAARSGRQAVSAAGRRRLRARWPHRRCTVVSRGEFAVARRGEYRRYGAGTPVERSQRRRCRRCDLRRPSGPRRSRCQRDRQSGVDGWGRRMSGSVRGARAEQRAALRAGARSRPAQQRKCCRGAWSDRLGLDARHRAAGTRAGAGVYRQLGADPGRVSGGQSCGAPALRATARCRPRVRRRDRPRSSADRSRRARRRRPAAAVPSFAPRRLFACRAHDRAFTRRFPAPAGTPLPGDLGDAADSRVAPGASHRSVRSRLDCHRVPAGRQYPVSHRCAARRANAVPAVSRLR